LDKRAEFNLPHHHPVLEGKVSCGDCHNPHHGQAVKAGGTSLLSENESCAQCHTAQFGPFVFEHEALREGCTTCHAVHGSVNQRMLISRNQTLCLKCHFQQQTAPGQLFIGGRDHTPFLSRGTCWSAGCHEAIHGSQIGSSMRF
jgi:DmsE family decaheme c-type cytochrome